MTSNERRTQWEERLAEYEASGQRISSWCKENSITPRQFYYWRRKLRTEHLKKDQPVKWLPLKYESHQLDIAGDAIAVHIGQATVEIRKGFNRELFREIIQVLQTI
jgi:transposase-like protein